MPIKKIKATIKTNPWHIPGLDHIGAGLPHWNSQHLFQLRLALELGDVRGSLVFCSDVNGALFCPEQPGSRAGTIKRLCGPIRSGGGPAGVGGTGLAAGARRFMDTRQAGGQRTWTMCAGAGSGTRARLWDGRTRAHASGLWVRPRPGEEAGAGTGAHRAWADGGPRGSQARPGRAQGCVCHHGCQAPPSMGAHTHTPTHVHAHMCTCFLTHAGLQVPLCPAPAPPSHQERVISWSASRSAHTLSLGSVSRETGASG